MTELDTKQKVLVAIYLEYQKDLPKMDNITSENLSLDNRVFNTALIKLENEGLIKGLKTTKFDVFTAFVMMTNLGINYVEEKLEIKPTLSNGEKVREVTKKVTSWGYTELKDFSAKFLAEFVKGILK
ncbi:YjcQ protein [Scopulibacillus darangshiensis]|uniref:YjcQ protein n=1 Tax=Scopulibacillus darangshiensis TaxID=442528 RepID=A0A4R2P410_9BACL|nr:YjcQ family protein [Scopulibacillus darangshiensis]TCP28784.1 YjcQ protein [Scopulibacillus darangshiensis]